MYIIDACIIPGDTGEEMGTKGCLKMKEGEPLKEDTIQFSLYIQRQVTTVVVSGY